MLNDAIWCPLLLPGTTPAPKEFQAMTHPFYICEGRLGEAKMILLETWRFFLFCLISTPQEHCYMPLAKPETQCWNYWWDWKGEAQVAPGVHMATPNNFPSG
jgi:hypothetical protein